MKLIVRAGLVALMVAWLVSANGQAQSPVPLEAGDAEAKQASERFEGTIALRRLLEIVAGHTDSAFIYDESQLRNSVTTLIGSVIRPRTRAEWFRFLGDMLASNGFTFVRVRDIDSPLALYRVLPVQSAGHSAGPPVTDPADLPDDTYFGTMVVHLEYVEQNSAQRALLNLSTRPGGVLQPLLGTNALLIHDTRVQLQRMHRLLQMIDQPPLRERRNRRGGDDEGGDDEGGDDQ